MVLADSCILPLLCWDDDGLFDADNAENDDGCDDDGCEEKLPHVLIQNDSRT